MYLKLLLKIFHFNLRFLATGETAKSLHYQFRVGASTVRSIVYDTCEKLWRQLQPTEMPVPTELRYREVAYTFQEIWNFPHVIGAIDGKHIQIVCPANSGSLYFNYKKHFQLCCKRLQMPMPCSCLLTLETMESIVMVEC